MADINIVRVGPEVRGLTLTDTPLWHTTFNINTNILKLIGIFDEVVIEVG